MFPFGSHAYGGRTGKQVRTGTISCTQAGHTATASGYNDDPPSPAGGYINATLPGHSATAQGNVVNPAPPVSGGGGFGGGQRTYRQAMRRSLWNGADKPKLKQRVTCTGRAVMRQITAQANGRMLPRVRGRGFIRMQGHAAEGLGSHDTSELDSEVALVLLEM